MDLADAIAIAGPFFLPVTHSGADMLETVVALSFISVTGGVSLGGPMDMLLQRLAIRMVAHAGDGGFHEDGVSQALLPGPRRSTKLSAPALTAK